MQRLALAVALAAALPLHASPGGYDKTTWGMTLAQVQKLYPGGTKKTTQAGDVHYFVMRKVATLDAIVGFNFTDGRLVFVDVEFPMPDTPVDMSRPGYARPTDEAAGSIISLVQSIGNSFRIRDQRAPREKYRPGGRATP
jgi:hypothetical protein